ncbi:MAG: hypothetical protein LIP01_15560 [Tannerellaceae bacterium]|nr:hypothetical protein [Tannerellaceae bacterium]
MRNKLMILILLFNLLSSNSQTSNELIPPLSGLPPSPDAAALGKYGQYPVALYNGLVNIDIPIHTIQLPTLTLPVSISYHASGIKVNKIASVVGLGWSLNAGGVITRSVRGIPDAKFGATGTITNEAAIQELGEDTQISTLQRYYTNERAGSYDSESDIYYYNACGMSGSFRFDSKGNLFQIPLSDNKIEYNSSTDIFIITGNDGTVYTFQDKETGYKQTGSEKYTSSWFLSHIKTTDNKSITFSYTVDNTYYYDYYIRSILTVAHTGKVPQGVEYIKSKITTDNTLLLKSITFPEGNLTFSYNSDRADRRKYRLINVHVNNNKNQRTKLISFTQSYFETNISSGDHSQNFHSRLKLDKFSVQDDHNKTISHSFEYNSHGLPPYYDPVSSSASHYSQDSWGYYNAAGNSTPLSYNNIPNYNLSQYPSANRDANPIYAQACILNKIIYPTGGYTIFEYEGNQTVNNRPMGGLRIKNILSYHDMDDKPVVKSFEYLNPQDNNYNNTSLLKGTCYTQGRIELNHPYPEVRLYDYFLSEPNLPMSYTGGAPVFYRKVIEYEGYPDNSNGKTEYTFQYLFEDARYYPLHHCSFPSLQTGTFLPYFNYFQEDRSWSRGNPLYIDTYKKSNGVFTLVKSIQYTYQTFNQEDKIVGFRSFSNFNTANRILPYPFSIRPLSGNELFQYTNILARTGLIKVKQVKEISYHKEQEVTQVRNYFYNKLNNQLEVSAIHEKQSDGSILKSSFQYPKDLRQNLSFCQNMTDKNMLNPVIIRTDSIDNKFLRSIQTNYKAFSSNVTVPYTIEVKEGNGPVQTEVTYDQYDDVGNVREIVKRNYTNEAIIWGYNKNTSSRQI